MQSVRRRDTKPELKLQRALRAAGLRFRKDRRPEKELKCTADVVFPEKRVCAFVDGCFWHCCPVHFALPRTNSRWWRDKVQETVRRDERQRRQLRRRGWCVIRVWEHDVTEHRIGSTVQRIKRLLNSR